MVNLGIKDAVKEWGTGIWNNYVRHPIEKKTEQLENSASEQFNKYSNQAKEIAYNKPKNYYYDQPVFYRGLFWIAIACLIVLWILSGS